MPLKVRADQRLSKIVKYGKGWSMKVKDSQEWARMVKDGQRMSRVLDVPPGFMYTSSILQVYFKYASIELLGVATSES